MTAQASAPSVPGFSDEAHVGLLHRRVVVDVDDDDLGAALLAGPHRMGHHVDLGDHRIGAPDDDAVGLRHLARIGAAQPAGAHHEAGPGEIGADRVEEAGIFLGVAQPIDAVALHQAHGAGIEVGPDGLAAVLLLGLARIARRRGRARPPSSPPSSCPRPWRRRGPAASAAGRDDGCARRSARPWRR